MDITTATRASVWQPAFGQFYFTKSEQLPTSIRRMGGSMSVSNVWWARTGTGKHYSRQIEGYDSQLVKTLTAHMGKESPLMQTLNPEAADGVISALTTATEKALTDQRERVLGEFSLDNEAGRPEPSGSRTQEKPRRDRGGAPETHR